MIFDAMGQARLENELRNGERNRPSKGLGKDGGGQPDGELRGRQ